MKAIEPINENEKHPVLSVLCGNKVDAFKPFGGSIVGAWNDTLLNQTINGVWARDEPPETWNKHFDATFAALASIGPKDELEGMMAAQLIAAHNAIMECYRRASQPKQTNSGMYEALNQATKLTRSFSASLNTLNKYRGKGEQKMTVEHVHVHAGGQAIVGSIEQNEGGYKKLEEQPHAQQVTYAFEPTVWCEDASEETVPIPSNEKWSVPYAWWEISGSTEK